MTHRAKDTAGLYRTGRDETERQLRFDRGTLLLVRSLAAFPDPLPDPSDRHQGTPGDSGPLQE
jgi:hypothetical protein